MTKTLAILLIVMNVALVNATSPNDYRKKKDTKITPTATTDGTYIYVDIRTADQGVITSFLRRGFTVYFDKKGKKKKRVGVSSPTLDRKKLGNTPPNSNERESRNSNEERELPVARMLEDIDRKAVYIKDDSAQEFHLDLNALDITINYSYQKEPQEGILVYKLKIPVSKIDENPIDFEKLTLGIISTPLPERENQGPQDRGGLSLGGGGRSQGGPGGGNRGGGGGRPGGQGQGGGQKKAPQQSEDVALWFGLTIS